MSIEHNNRKINAVQSEGIVQVLAEIRNGAEDSEGRRISQQYLQDAALMQVLEGMGRFTFEKYDYTPDLVPREFMEPEPPDLSNVVPQAEREAAEKHAPHIMPVAVAGVVGIMLDVLIGSWGLLSVVFLAGSGFLYYQQIQARTKAVALARQAAEATVASMQEAFLDEVARERAEFEAEEADRIAAINSLIDGDAALMLKAAQESALSVSTPFLLRGRAELYAGELLLSFEMPPNDFVPTVEWREWGEGRFSPTERSTTSINRCYAEAVVSAVVQVVLRNFERVSALNKVVVNGFGKDDDKAVCLFAASIAASDVQFIVSSGGGTTVIHELGIIRHQGAYSLLQVEPQLPAWAGEVTDHEVARGNISTTYKLNY